MDIDIGVRSPQESLTRGSSLIPPVNPIHAPAAAVPNPANVVKIEGKIIVAPRDESTGNKLPVAPPHIAYCRQATMLPMRQRWRMTSPRKQGGEY